MKRVKRWLLIFLVASPIVLLTGCDIVQELRTNLLLQAVGVIIVLYFMFRYSGGKH